MHDTTYKAQHQQIHLGDRPLDIFRLPDGRYCLSLSSAAEAIGKRTCSIFQFLRSKALKTIVGNGSQFLSFPDELNIEGYPRAIVPVGIDVATLYWQAQAFKRDANAQALVNALLKQSLRDLADAAFGVKRTDGERQESFAQDLHQPPPPMADLNELYALRLELAQTQVELAQTKEKLAVASGRAETTALKLKLESAYRRPSSFAANLIVGGQPYYSFSHIQRVLGHILNMPVGEDVAIWLFEHGYRSNHPDWMHIPIPASTMAALPESALIDLADIARRERAQQLRDQKDADELWFEFGENAPPNS